MPGLLDYFQPRNAANEPVGFGDALQSRSNSLIGLGLGLMSGPGTGAGLEGYQHGSTLDAAQATRQQQHQIEQARLKLAQQQANRDPEAIRQLRAAGVPQEKWADYLYPKQDEWHAGKVTHREQDYPYRANLRTGQYEWGPLGAPPGVGGAQPSAPAATNPYAGGASIPFVSGGAPSPSGALSSALSTTGVGSAAGAGVQEQEPPKPPAKPPGYDTWLPSVQKEYDKTMVQQQAKQAAAEPEHKAQILESGTVALRELDAVLKQSEEFPNMVAGPFGNTMKGVWGSRATDVAKRLDVVKANIAFDKLQAMRRSNPTGGALGNVSDKDMALLQSSIASLDQAQSAPQFLESVRNVRTHYQNVLSKIQGPSSGSTTGQTSTGVRKYNRQSGMIE